jgi:hypothetical protein
MDKITELQDLADRHFQAVNECIMHAHNSDKDVSINFAHMLIFIQSELRLSARLADASEMRKRVLALTETVRRMGAELTGCEL